MFCRARPLTKGQAARMAAFRKRSNGMDMHSRDAVSPDMLVGCPPLERTPAIEFDQLLRPGQRAVILATHPLDEVLACGGLLQVLSQRGHALQLISITDEPDGQAGRSVAQALENSDSLRRLGIPAMRMKWIRGRFRHGLLDGRADGLEAFLLRYVRGDDVVFAPWRLDGDADREAVGRCAQRAWPPPAWSRRVRAFRGPARCRPSRALPT